MTVEAESEEAQKTFLNSFSKKILNKENFNPILVKKLNLDLILLHLIEPNLKLWLKSPQLFAEALEPVLLCLNLDSLHGISIINALKDGLISCLKSAIALTRLDFIFDFILYLN